MYDRPFIEEEVVLCVSVLLTSHSNPNPNGFKTKNIKSQSTQVTFQTVGHKEKYFRGKYFRRYYTTSVVFQIRDEKVVFLKLT